MIQWADLSSKERLILGGFILIVLVLILLAWIGYFSGGWESATDAVQGK